MPEERRTRHRVCDVAAEKRVHVPVLRSGQRDVIRLRRDPRPRARDERVDDVAKTSAREMAGRAAKTGVAKARILRETTGRVENACHRQDVLPAPKLVE